MKKKLKFETIHDWTEEKAVFFSCFAIVPFTQRTWHMNLQFFWQFHALFFIHFSIICVLKKVLEIDLCPIV
jgi:hypothetical protein